MVALLIGVAALSPISAQSIRLLPKPPRPFEVERLERWAPEYLTVTRSFYIAKKRSGDASPVTVLNANGMPDQQALWFEVIPQPGDPETYRLVPGTVIPVGWLGESCAGLSGNGFVVRPPFPDPTGSRVGPVA